MADSKHDGMIIDNKHVRFVGWSSRDSSWSRRFCRKERRVGGGQTRVIQPRGDVIAKPEPLPRDRGVDVRIWRVRGLRYVRKIFRVTPRLSPRDNYKLFGRTTVRQNVRYDVSAAKNRARIETMLFSALAKAPRRLRVCCCPRNSPLCKRPHSTGENETCKKNTRSTVYYLSSIGVLTVGLSYAAVPLYKMFCQVSAAASSVWPHRTCVTTFHARHLFSRRSATEGQSVIVYRTPKWKPWSLSETERSKCISLPTRRPACSGVLNHCRPKSGYRFVSLYYISFGL